MINSKEIRKQFLQFFSEKSHKIVSSSPIVIKDDPTLMFTNAGMNPFKDYFIGNKTSTNKRVANTQKCLRVSGKHNDLEEVGVDTYHHTMFEMLGNWSFGDYFKKEAIAWAWQLLTEKYKLNSEHLYATVFGGDSQENLDKDTESENYWKAFLPAERILYGNKQDNFWEMGDIGPCGPCSELHLDLRSEKEKNKVSGATLVNTGHPQVIEIWNLVFIQYNRLASGFLEELPEKHIDTGMGFERLVMAIQQKKSTYDTDIFHDLIEWICQEAKTRYGSTEKEDIAIRAIADHIRAIAFIIADGQLPSNNGAGYVIRRILRRAVRYGYSFLTLKTPFLYKLLPVVAQQFGEVFPELLAQEAFISRVIHEEETTFLHTLDSGMKKLSTLLSVEKKEIKGADMFELYDTHGFPPDLTSQIAKEHGFCIDHKGFEQAMNEQINRGKYAGKQQTGDWMVIHSEKSSNFIGYTHTETITKIWKMRKVMLKGQTNYQIILKETPFYANSGGQVGDTGYLMIGTEKVDVFNTLKENNLILHYTKTIPKHPYENVHAVIDKEKRTLISCNHTATHLLHAALKEILGKHVRQSGSLINNKELRFDFSHFKKVDEQELMTIEHLVNKKIRENISLDEKLDIPIQDAKKMGATALFGEKYGARVRVITFDPRFSIELCGGTHVSQTGTIGFFKIMSESSVAAGIRRIHAIAAVSAENYIQERLILLNEIEKKLKYPKHLAKTLEDLVSKNRAYQKQINQIHSKQIQQLKLQMKKNIQQVNNINLIIFKGDFPSADALKQVAFELKREITALVLLVGTIIDNKPIITVMIADNIVKEGKNAIEVVQNMAHKIQGKGGGQPFYAIAGGKDITGIDEALKVGKNMLIQ